MDTMTQHKLKAAGKMAFGAARIASGLATATGHGLIGAYCQKHNAMHAAYRLAKGSIERGTALFNEGLADWQAADAPASAAAPQPQQPTGE